ncbi:MAG: ABC transporter permease [Parasphingopyxis sp.]|nr:ABC transporter permease [Sphingomonadales bacterium]
MHDQQKTRTLPNPGEPAIPLVNWGGLRTLYIKEVRRFFKVQLQTIWAPALTTLLFLVIFTVALGRGDRTILGVPFEAFLAPGLIVMGMIQNAFANSSFALLVGKIQGTIVDYLMPPLSTLELLTGLVAGAVTRAICVGLTVWVAMWLWGIDVSPAHLWAIAYFGLTGSAMLAFFGVLTSMWAEKFDHAAAVTNFVVQPLALLSGTFYTIERLDPVFQSVSQLNPFFYVISGFRYGFIDASDSNILAGVLVLAGVNIALCLLCYGLLSRGWRIKS